MRKWLPTLVGLSGCALFTWLDAECFFLAFPLLPFACVLVLILSLVPLQWSALGSPWRTVPLASTTAWMLVLPWLPTGQTKRFVLAVGGLEPGMSQAEMRVRMEPFLERGAEFSRSAEEAPGYPRLIATTFLSDPFGTQTCQVFLHEGKVSVVQFEYVD